MSTKIGKYAELFYKNWPLGDNFMQRDIALELR